MPFFKLFDIFTIAIKGGGSVILGSMSVSFYSLLSKGIKMQTIQLNKNNLTFNFDLSFLSKISDFKNFIQEKIQSHKEELNSKRELYTLLSLLQELQINNNFDIYSFKELEELETTISHYIENIDNLTETIEDTNNSYLKEVYELLTLIEVELSFLEGKLIECKLSK